jgi:hypothetical protein
LEQHRELHGALVDALLAHKVLDAERMAALGAARSG